VALAADQHMRALSLGGGQMLLDFFNRLHVD